MSDPVVDPGRFRLRAFEVDWIRPLRERGGNQLDALLAEEANHWVVLGQRLGYFASGPSIDGTSGSGSRHEGFFDANMEVAASEFARHLSEAQEDLTPERREFLHLILFAEDEQFERRLGQLSALHALIADRPEEPVPAAMMEDVAWALIGAESQLVDFQASHPARWRSSDQRLAAVASPRAPARLKRVHVLRDRLAAASVLGRFAPNRGGQTISATAPSTIVADADEVTTLTLGIETLGGIRTSLIPRGSPLPATKTQTFSTATDNQTSVEVNVFLGERSMVADNRSLGQFQMPLAPPAPKGVPQIEITFEIDREGHLNVTARNLDTGAEKAATLPGLSDIDPAEIEAMIRDAESHRDDDLYRLTLAESRNEADVLIGLAERLLATPGYNISDAARSEVKSAIREVQEAMSSDDLSKLGRATDALAAATTRITSSASPPPARASEAGTVTSARSIENIELDEELDDLESHEE